MRNTTKQNNKTTKTENLPAFYVESWESPQGSFSGEELKSTLCIPDFFDTQKPYKEVEPVHKESSKVRTLWTKDK